MGRPSSNARGQLALLGLVVYVTAFLALGGLLAFPVYAWLSDAQHPEFDSVLHRVVGLAALLLLPLYLMGSGSWERAALGFGCSARTFLRNMAAGFAVGGLLATPLLGALLLLGVRAVTPSALGAAPEVASFLAVALAAALLIGVVEESYFRGALLARLRPLPTWAAVTVVSAVYAALHFVGSPVASQEVGWLTGLSSIGCSELQPDAFLALIGAGMLLGALRLRSGHVALGAGVHAGWVWAMKIAQEYTDVAPSSPLLFLEGAYGGTMGYLGLAWIAAVGAGWFAWERAVARRRGGRPGAAHP